MTAFSPLKSPFRPPDKKFIFSQGLEKEEGLRFHYLPTYDVVIFIAIACQTERDRISESVHYRNFHAVRQ